MLVFFVALFSFKKKNENLKLFYLTSFQLILIKTIFLHTLVFLKLDILLI